ncbi:ribonuclease H2 subunit A [Xylaria bambusicola]|uniref:ribonuclease H2 subunit A n=1 Tax=Xylaria bambusicola TaxID=326684 RepID=UPI0020079FB0|nr:ribonuclease H2 subunit A [Xylaria bambusicola]KAI0518451.1 ribonuclease H2 subunit A [Xylaria bambusicola]
MEDTQMDEGNIALETPVPDVFVPPSIHHGTTIRGESYTHFSPVPPSLAANESDSSTGVPCVLGVDEAGRGPVLGPMVYGVFYLPIPQSEPLLKETHHFDDSKVLTPAVRSSLMGSLCTADTDLHETCGWAISSLSARDIGANMMRPGGATYNLNAQAMDATAALIQGVMARGVNVREIYVDTIGQPATYQKRLESVFPTVKITVAKKADSLYPCVSAASVCAKVTRDAALEVLYEAWVKNGKEQNADGDEAAEVLSWGSGYPSDARCVAWLKQNMHPIFGWGPECRFSWGTAKDMLEAKGGVKVEWPADDDESTSRLTDFFAASGDREKDADELGTWFGTPAGLEAF